MAGLLRLPLEFDTEWTDETEDTVCLLEQQQLNQSPIKASDIRQATAKDPVLYYQKCTILQCKVGLGHYPVTSNHFTNTDST